MTDFLGTLTKVVETTKDTLENAARTTIHLMEQAFKDIISDMKTTVSHTGSDIEAFAKAAFEALSKMGHDAYTDILQLRADFMDMIHTLTNIMRDGMNAAETMIQSAESTAQALAKEVGKIGSAVESAATDAKKGIGEVVSTASEAIVSTVTAILADAKSIAEDIGSTVEGVALTVYNTLKSVITDVLSVLENAFDSAISVVKAAVGDLEDAVRVVVADVEKVVEASIRYTRDAANDIAAAAKSAIADVDKAVRKAEGATDDIVTAVEKLPGSVALAVAAFPIILVGIFGAIVIILFFRYLMRNDARRSSR